MHQPVINLYHKKVHQPCTNLYQSCVNYSSTMTRQYVPTSSTTVSTMYSTCTSTKSPHQFRHPNLICTSVIYLVYIITFLQTFLNKRLAFSSNLFLVSHA